MGSDLGVGLDEGMPAGKDLLLLLGQKLPSNAKRHVKRGWQDGRRAGGRKRECGRREERVAE